MTSTIDRDSVIDAVAWALIFSKKGLGSVALSDIKSEYVQLLTASFSVIISNLNIANSEIISRAKLLTEALSVPDGTTIH